MIAHLESIDEAKRFTARRKKIQLQIEHDLLSYHLHKGMHLELPSDKNEPVEATPEQIDFCKRFIPQESRNARSKALLSRQIKSACPLWWISHSWHRVYHGW
jgi:hypothetical protein